ncbi:ATP-grasp fold amidoligase family protein [Labilibaculum sp.]|uniref:ATP-grasp fold amidoligase family protein n=1 Tax=Labilibaculum sp. TaxID=2060723 RepID=UPI002AA8034D|nr:ATP-grasp fold amidoligase family protein [Labilibaculum sp.]
MSKLKEFLKRSQTIVFVYEIYKYQKHKYLFNKDPRLAAEEDYMNDFKQKLDWENPKNIVEKNFWMQFNTDTSIWTRCADKYLVREYVEEKGCGDTLNELYGKWDDANDIDFSSLPDQFVLKTNHGCNSVMVIKDKSKLNFKKTIKKFNKWLNSKYGIIAGQMHYLKIQPCVIAEKYLEDSSPNGTLIDYKMFCFNGEVESICIHSGRNLETHDFSVEVYDSNWKEIPVSLRNSGNRFPRPKSLDKMIETCKKLGTGIPFVRIDFYEIDGKVIFGEMTFTPGSGFLTYEYYDYLGTKLDIKKLKS